MSAAVAMSVVMDGLYIETADEVRALRLTPVGLQDLADVVAAALAQARAEGEAAGRAAERAAVVAYLREQAEGDHDPWLLHLADDVAAGQHWGVEAAMREAGSAGGAA